MSQNSFDARADLTVGDRTVEIFRLDALQAKFDVARLPFSLKILLENLLRTEGNGAVTAADIEALARWDAKAEPSQEIAFSPARVVMQDFTGVPAIVDLAAMRLWSDFDDGAIQLRRWSSALPEILAIARASPQLGLADASLLALAPVVRSTRIATFDRHDFSAARTADGEPFVLLP